MTEDRKSRATHFVILLGWVSLFADLCYEGMGARMTGVSICTGPTRIVRGIYRMQAEKVNVVKTQRLTPTYSR